MAAAVVVVGVLLGGREDRAASATAASSSTSSGSPGAASPKNSSSSDDDGFGFRSVSLTAAEQTEQDLLTPQGEQRTFMELVKANLEQQQRRFFERNTCSLDSSRLYVPLKENLRAPVGEEAAAATTIGIHAGNPAPRPPKIAVCVVGATRTLIEPGVFVSLKHNLLLRNGPNTHLFMYLMHGEEMSRRGGFGNGATEEQMRYVKTCTELCINV